MASVKGNAVVRAARRRRWDMEDGRAVVESWKRSGEPIVEFARRHGLKPQRLSRWARRLEIADETVRFHPVCLVRGEEEDRRSERPIEVVLVDGRVVRLPPGFAAKDLERALSVLALGV